MSERATMVFDIDIKTFSGNPFRMDTPFGKPETIAPGDQLERSDRLENALMWIRDHDPQTVDAALAKFDIEI